MRLECEKCGDETIHSLSFLTGKRKFDLIEMLGWLLATFFVIGVIAWWQLTQDQIGREYVQYIDIMGGVWKGSLVVAVLFALRYLTRSK